MQNRLKDITGRIDELSKHYKKSMQLAEKLKPAFRQKKKPKDHASCRWALGREHVQVSRVIRKLGFTNPNASA